MPKFPVDAPKARVVRALMALGFELVDEREHIALRRIKGSTLRTICRQSDVAREDFLKAFEEG